MNRFKKLICLLCVAVLLLQGLAACGGEDASTSPVTEPKDAIYTIRVSSASGRLPKGLTVYVYENASKKVLVDMGSLNDKGEFVFTDKISDQYVAVIEGMPEEGYDLKESYLLTGTRTEIVLTSSVVQGADPVDKVYQLGDVMRDFTVTTTDGRTLKLSELLKEKDAVVLNFWHTKSQACRNEIPLLQQVYQLYGDQVELIAMNAMQGETEGQVSLFQMENGITYPVAKVDNKWERAMRVTSYPTTVVIDRYGVICLMHVGEISDAQLLAGVFAHFAADDYEQKLIRNLEDIQSVELPVGTQSNPYETYGDHGGFEVTVEPNGEYHVMIYKSEGMTLHIENPNAYVLFQGIRYDPDENGVIALPITTPDAKTGAHVIVGNTGPEPIVVHALLKAAEELPLGSMMNPFALSLGDLTTVIAEGNDQGVYYSMVVEETGYLKIAVTNLSEEAPFEVQLYNLTTMTQVNLTERLLLDKNGNPYVQVAVSEGDRIRVGFLSLPNEEGLYPETTVNAVVTLSDQAEEIAYTVTFRDEEGNPMAGVSITVWIEGVATTLFSDEEGQIVMSLAPNNYSIKVNVPEGYVLATTQYLLTASNPNREIVLRLYVAQEVTYTVYVVDNEGNPVPGVVVAIGDRFERTDEAGVVSLVLLEGNYSATVVPPAGYSIDKPTYAFGDRTTLTVVLTKETASEDQATYTVTVVDCNGKPFTNVLVSFSGTSVVQQVDSKGVASAVLEKGTYQVVLLFSGGNVMGYETATAVVTEANTSVVIEVAPYADGKFAAIRPGGVDASGRYLSLGGVFVQLTAGGRTYFLFTPQVTGMYEIVTTNSNAKLENWNDIQNTEKTEAGLNNNVLTLQVAELGNTYVFAINAAENVTETIVKIRRTGDVIPEPEYEVYQGTTVPTEPYVPQLEEGQHLEFLDLTKNHTLVRDENGVYHLDSVDGPVVMMNLQAMRYGISIRNLISTGNLQQLTYDEKGNLVKCVDYTECMFSYVCNCDQQTGVYALTDDLITIIQGHGESAGWFDATSANYLFEGEENLNPDVLWMFLLCVAV